MKLDQGPLWTDVLTAVGTVSAVVLALVLAALPTISRRWSKPRLRSSTGLREPFVRAVGGTGLAHETMRLRVGVTNAGRSTAMGVRAQLAHWWELDPERTLAVEWEELDSDPLPMKWVSIRPGDDRPGVAPEVSIVHKLTELLDLAEIDDKGRLRLLFDDERQALFGRHATDHNRTWRVQFVLAGANCRPEEWTIEFTVKDGRFEDVSVSEPPPESRHVGRVSLMRDLSQGIRRERQALAAPGAEDAPSD